jgi:alanine dehydrogenase
MPIILTRKDLRKLLTMEEVIQALEGAFLSYSRGKTIAPVRLALEVKPYKGISLLMPSFQEEPDGLGVKLVSVFPENIRKDLPTIFSYYLFCHPETGALLALMDGAMLTGLRTGGASGLASRYLGRKDSKVLGVFGAGVQAGFQLEAMKVVFPMLKEAYVYDSDKTRLAEFLRNLPKDPKIEVREATSSDEIAERADVIVTATTSKTPVFKGSLLKPGTHVNAIGGFTPTMQELDEETIIRSKVVVDTYEGCLSEAGELLIPMEKGIFSKEKIHSDLAGLVSHKKPGRENPEEITLFKSVGTAIEDLAAARLAYQKAMERGIGLSFEI